MFYLPRGKKEAIETIAIDTSASTTPGQDFALLSPSCLLAIGGK
jgi:hypothetical protein